MSDAALNLLTEFEGFSSAPYQDPGGTWTIGYGSIRLGGTGPGRVTASTHPIDEPTARAWASAELAVCMTEISRVVQVPLSDNEKAALEDFVYNLGIGNFTSSTLLRLLNAGDYDGAAAQIGRWVYTHGTVLAGLVRRRAAETQLFTSPDATV